MSYSEQLLDDLGRLRSMFPTHDLTDRGNVIANLLFMYHVLRASENLLRVAVKQTPAGKLKRYLSEHLDEERGHERWLAADLLSQGLDVTTTLPPTAAVVMCGSLYYLIYHVDPAALLGYMLALEGFPLDLEVVEQLEAAHGDKLMRTLRFHAVHDRDHRTELCAVIDELAPDRQALVRSCALTTTMHLRAVATDLA